MKANDVNRIAQPESAITRPQTEREILFHALAVQHAQRSLILTALQSIDTKLAALLDIASRKGGLP